MELGRCKGCNLVIAWSRADDTGGLAVLLLNNFACVPG